MYIVQKHYQDDLTEEDGVCRRIGDMKNAHKILV
jgi:hypothetical protein